MEFLLVGLIFCVGTYSDTLTPTSGCKTIVLWECLISKEDNWFSKFIKNYLSFETKIFNMANIFEVHKNGECKIYLTCTLLYLCSLLTYLLLKTYVELTYWIAIISASVIRQKGEF